MKKKWPLINRTHVQRWLWPIFVLLWSLLTMSVVIFEAPTGVRAAVILPFLGFCPGISFVGLLQLRDLTAEVILAISLSISLSLIVASIVLYSRYWSPVLILFILVALSALGVLLQGLLLLRTNARIADGKGEKP